jgi:hypothetical protein
MPGSSLPQPAYHRGGGLIDARIAPEDHPIVSMLIDGAPPHEVADALGVTEKWLELRLAALTRSRREVV